MTRSQCYAPLQPPRGPACQQIQHAWDLESSTSIFAAGCCTDILFRMVAPSLVMMTSPSAAQTCVGQRARHPYTAAIAPELLPAAIWVKSHLVMIGAHTILSMPRGPRLVRTASATALAASMLLIRTSFLRAFCLHTGQCPILQDWQGRRVGKRSSDRCVHVAPVCLPFRWPLLRHHRHPVLLEYVAMAGCVELRQSVHLVVIIIHACSHCRLNLAAVCLRALEPEEARC